ncbi:hypothetical protein ACQPW1_29965 [Nocardia sp. CA-128927]|uniref:hypothetical protein n=1 Tax=Nocardia sp. CA-128927 TaxID=3239975 RepID=UPI003D985D02
MNSRKFVSTSLVAIAATLVAAGTAHGESEIPFIAGGSDRGVNYTATLSDDHLGVTTHLSSGKFDVAPDEQSVTVTAADGTLLAQLPITFNTAGREGRLLPEIDRDGTTLTLRPAGNQIAVTDVAFNDSMRNMVQPQLKDAGLIGGLVFGLICGFVGAITFGILGLAFFIVGAVPAAIMGAVGVGAFCFSAFGAMTPF